MSPAAVIVLCIVTASVALGALVVLVALRRRRVERRHVVLADDGDSIREQARAQQEGEATRGVAAGMAYGSGVGGNTP